MTVVEFKHAIGDAVFVASAYEVEKKIIKALKVESLRETKKYGFDVRSYDMFRLFPGSDDYEWISGSNIYLSKEGAIQKHEALKLKRENDEAKQKRAEKAEKRKELKQQLAEIEEELETL